MPSMKSYLIALLWTVFLFSASCKKSVKSNCDGPELNCTVIRCVISWSYMDFKLVDKTTGADLIFGANPRYTQADVKIFYDAARTIPLNFTIDNAGKKFSTGFTRNEMYLEIKGTTVYKMNAEFKAVGCCSNRVKSMMINSKSVCTCCGDVIAIPVD